MADTGPGFRYFKCFDCEHEWISSSRDRNSPSGESCPHEVPTSRGYLNVLFKCGTWVMGYPCTTEQYDRLHRENT